VISRSVDIHQVEGLIASVRLELAIAERDDYVSQMTAVEDDTRPPRQQRIRMLRGFLEDLKARLAELQNEARAAQAAIAALSQRQSQHAQKKRQKKPIEKKPAAYQKVRALCEKHKNQSAGWIWKKVQRMGLKKISQSTVYRIHGDVKKSVS
jgi:hypothetical protein